MGTQSVKYALNEIRVGTILRQGGLRVEHVVFTPGRGLELHTSRPDGYMGAVIYPHPDELLDVVHMPSLSVDDEETLRISTSDYPWADARR